MDSLAENAASEEGRGSSDFEAEHVDFGLVCVGEELKVCCDSVDQPSESSWTCWMFLYLSVTRLPPCHSSGDRHLRHVVIHRRQQAVQSGKRLQISILGLSDLLGLIQEQPLPGQFVKRERGGIGLVVDNDTESTNPV